MASSHFPPTCNILNAMLPVNRMAQALEYIISHDLCYVLDDGRIHKAINVKNKMYIIEELVIFPEPQSVQHIELDDEKVLHFTFNLIFFAFIMHA